MRKLSNKSIITNSVGVIYSSIIVVVALFIALSGVDGSPEVSNFMTWLVVIGFGVILFGVLYSAVWVKLFGYTLEDNEVKIERGVISKSYDSIPYSRIQNVGIERSLLERILGISTVNIQTAGASGISRSEGNIPGVDKGVAEQAREEIMGKARENNQGGGI